MLELPQVEREFKRLRTESYIKGNLGVLRLIEEDLAGGKALLEESLKIDGRNQLAHNFYDKVVPALESRKLDYKSVYALVVAFEELSFKRPNATLREMSGVLNRSPDFRLAYVFVAETQRRYFDFAGCEKTLRIALKRFPEDTEIQANRIRCTLMRYGISSKDALPAVEDLKALAARDPNDPLVQEILLLITD
jgi:hypothetical protein